MARLKIECGDPKNDPASYTRFVMPFAHKIEQINGSSSNPVGDEYFYEVVAAEKLEAAKWRHGYFTKETREALFKRATWMELRWKEGTARQCFQLNFKNNEKHSLVMKTPVIVLFEAPYDSENSRMKPPDKTDKPSDETNMGLDLMHVGFLLIDIYFCKPSNEQHAPTLDNLLELNELFRYRAAKYDEHEAKELRPFFGVKKQLFDTVLGKLSYGRNSTHLFARWNELLKFPIRCPQGTNGEAGCAYYHLLPRGWKRDDWDVYADNRNFVWTCAIIRGGGEALQREFHPYGRKLDPHLYGHWVKLLNVDSPDKNGNETETHTSVREFERAWAKEHTYHRWEELGTYYGFNYHSGAMLATDLRTEPLWKHFRLMYFDMVLLLFYLRVVLFRFSTQLFKISAEARTSAPDDNKQIEQWSRDFEQLRWQFTLFTNLYQFPLISNQQQGVEMYTLARKHMDVDELYKEVQQEIHNSHEFLLQKQQQAQTNLTTILTVVASIGLLFSIVLAFLSLITVDDLKKASILGLKPTFGFGWRYAGAVLGSWFLLFLIVVLFAAPLSKFLNWLAKFPAWLKSKF